MPVEKSKQKLYGKIVGHLQNIGISREAAKDKADSAVAKTASRKSMKSKGMKSKGRSKRASRTDY
jgi:hypothetical protein